MEHTNIYISDLLSVPTPKHAVSRRDYQRKLQRRRLLWALLPYLGQAVLALAVCGLMVFGLLTVSLGFGG